MRVQLEQQMFTASLGLGANIQTQSKELRKTKGLNTIKGNEAQMQIITGNKGKQKGSISTMGASSDQNRNNPGQILTCIVCSHFRGLIVDIFKEMPIG